MCDLIIPCAGKSSRFPDRPKWLLTCPNGNLMIQESIKGLDLSLVKSIYITFLEEHIQQYCNKLDLNLLFKFTNKPIYIYILKEGTKSQSETVYKTIKYFNIQGSIFIKDCDNYYEHYIKNENSVCFVPINKETNISKLYNKSYIKINNLNNLDNICEKEIISQNICVGGYSFNDSNDFLEIYDEIKNLDLNHNELYISHIIYKALLKNMIFKVQKVNRYIDWGTIEEWNKYKSEYKTLFIDLDGVLVYNSSEYMVPKWGETEAINENVNYLKQLHQTNKVKIIITTARKSTFRDITIKQLKKYKIPYDDIIFDLYHAQRILINDYSNTNKYPTAISINLKRNSKELNQLLN